MEASTWLTLLAVPLQTYSPAIPLLSSQVLLGLGSGLDSVFTGYYYDRSDLPMYYLPGSFNSLVSSYLQQQVTGGGVRGFVQQALPSAGFSNYALQWHLGIREAAALELWQQQKREEGLPATAAAVAAAVERAYGSADSR